jgi:hypothetical protein
MQPRHRLDYADCDQDLVWGPFSLLATGNRKRRLGVLAWGRWIRVEASPGRIRGSSKPFKACLSKSAHTGTKPSGRDTWRNDKEQLKKLEAERLQETRCLQKVGRSAPHSEKREKLRLHKNKTLKRLLRSQTEGCFLVCSTPPKLLNGGKNDNRPAALHRSRRKNT